MDVTAERLARLRARWNEYDRAFRGLPDEKGKPYPFDGSYESAVAAYRDWAQALESAS